MKVNERGLGLCAYSESKSKTQRDLCLPGNRGRSCDELDPVSWSVCRLSLSPLLLLFDDVFLCGGSGDV